MLPQALAGWTLYYKSISMCVFVYTTKFTLLLSCMHGYACVCMYVRIPVCTPVYAGTLMCRNACVYIYV